MGRRTIFVIARQPRRIAPETSGSGYFTFLPAIETVGFPAMEFAVAETFGFSCFGFFASLLLFLPLAIVCPSKMQ